MLKTSRRIDCPIPGYESAYVVLPAEWLGEHLVKRDEVLDALSLKNATLLRASIALAIADDWGGIPGLEQRNDPAKWELHKTPLTLLLWLVATVYNDFERAFVIPKG